MPTTISEAGAGITANDASSHATLVSAGVPSFWKLWTAMTIRAFVAPAGAVAVAQLAAARRPSPARHSSGPRRMLAAPRAKPPRATPRARASSRVLPALYAPPLPTRQTTESIPDISEMGVQVGAIIL